MDTRMKLLIGNQPPFRRASVGYRRLQLFAGIAGALILLHGAQASAQTRGRLDPAECLKPGAPMLWMPELVTQNGKLSGTIRLADQERRLGTSTECANQFLRFFEGVDARRPPIPPAPALRLRPAQL